MKTKVSFLLKIICVFAAAAILLTGCSEKPALIDDAPSTVETEESAQPESSGDADGEAEKTDGTTDTSAEESTDAEGSETTETTAEVTTATTAATTATTTTTAVTTATTTTAAVTTTPKPVTTTTPKPVTTTTPKPVTTTTPKPAVTTTTTAATTTKPVTTTTTTPPPSTPSLDPNEIYNILIAFKSRYPEGTSWTNENRSYTSNALFIRGYGCAAFALELSDAAFGDLPKKEHHDISAIKVGDILRLNGDNHSVIVLEVRSNSVIIAEGNYNSSVHWGRELTFSDIENTLTYIWTRYP